MAFFKEFESGGGDYKGLVWCRIWGGGGGSQKYLNQMFGYRALHYTVDRLNPWYVYVNTTTPSVTCLS
jgi:hypothetical protein